MAQALSVLLFTYDKSLQQNYVNYICQQQDFHLTNATGEIQSITDICSHQFIDILIIDMDKHVPGSDMLHLIGTLNTSSFSKPYVLVISDTDDKSLLDQLHLSGADFIISRQKPDYSVQNVFDFLRLAHEKPQTPCRSHHDYYPRMLQIIHKELDAAGLNHCQVGYGYLAEAILLYLEKDNLHIAPILSARHNKSTLSVARAMQNAIDCAWKKVTNVDFSPMHRIAIHSSRGIPTVSDFVRHYGNIIRNM